MRKLVFIVLLTITLVACGDDSGTSANDGKDTELAEVSSSSKAVSSSSKRSVGNPYSSSSAKNVSSSSQKGDAGTRSSSSGQAPSGMTSSSKATTSSSKTASSSSTPRNDVKSSSSKRSEGDPSSSSQKIASSSSSVIPASSGNHPSSSSKKAESSSSEKNSVLSSSRDYTPYAHDTCLAGNWNVHKDAYKTFIDPRNGRSYYYYTAVSSKTGKSVTVMAENLNVGDMVLGENDQNDDSNIERYCYNNDTTYCDEFGGLYQWAEMMQLPSRCNTESCADLIQLNHQGICPDGWRLFTWDDYLIIRQYEDKYDEGISGLRSQCFNGTNTSGFSLVGAGKRTENGDFKSWVEYAFWNYPQEYGGSALTIVYSALVSEFVNESPAKNSAGSKLEGVSVRCVKLE
jgi:uncharacterized protein (TIGR02145 family)